MKSQINVLRFGEYPVPRALGSLRCLDAGEPGAVDEALAEARRVVIVGAEADVSAVLTRLLRLDRLDVEVAHARGLLSAQRATRAAAQRVPLIRDDTGTALVGSAHWLPPDGAATVCGEAVVDDTVLFDGDVAGVRIEPTSTMPGLRAALLDGRRRRWVSGRAAQLGTTGARLVRDGVPGPREVKRSTFYRHTTGWLRVG
jgi:hypothetical protein